MFVIKDIGERKQAEEKLRISEERFRALCNAAAGMCISDLEGRLLEVNQALGRSPDIARRNCWH